MPNHPNRGQKDAAANPAPEVIRAAREAAQLARGLGVTAAQAWCAGEVHSTTRRWQEWEEGKHRMHPGLGELFERKHPTFWGSAQLKTEA